MIGCLLLVLVVRKPDYPYILVLKCKKEALKEIGEKLECYTHYTVKSRKVETRPLALQGKAQASDGKQEAQPSDDKQEAQASDSKYKANSENNTLEDKDHTILELDIEITLKEYKHESSAFDETEFVDELAAIPGVSKAILVTYNGAYMT